VFMLILAITSLLAGAVLGLRFKFLILVPAMGFASAFVVLIGVLVAQGVWRIVGSMVIVVVFVQLGYFGGFALRSVWGARAADRGSASMPTTTEVPSSDLRNRPGASSRFEASKQLGQV
jgi:hypothetical protein